MTPREKAHKMCNDLCWAMGYGNLEKEVKDVALFSVDEIIDAIDFDWMEVQNLESIHRYWEEVKQEIEKL